MTKQPEPDDTCRPVEIDGEMIRVRGAAEMSDESRAALAEVISAAKRKFAAGPAPVRQQVRAAAFNAVAPALQRHDEWLRLTVRRAVADAVLTAIEEHLDIGDAEAWCKTCRRVWDGPRHRCESDAEQRLAKVRDLRSDLRGITGARWIADALDTILAAPIPDPAAGPTVAEAAADDRRWPLEKEGE